MGCSKSKNQDTHEPVISVKKTPNHRNQHQKQKSSIKKTKKTSIYPTQNQAETDGITQGKATTKANEIEHKADFLVIQKQSSIVSLDGVPNRKKRISFCINGDVQELEIYQNEQNNPKIQKDEFNQNMETINQSKSSEIQHKQQNSNDNIYGNTQNDQQKQKIELRQKSRSSSALDGSIKDVKKLGNSISRRQKNSQGSSISQKKNNHSHKSSINNNINTQRMNEDGQGYHSIQSSIDQSNQNQHTKQQQQQQDNTSTNQIQYLQEQDQKNQLVSQDQQISQNIRDQEQQKISENLNKMNTNQNSFINNKQIQKDQLLNNQNSINNTLNHESPQLFHENKDFQELESKTNSFSRQNTTKSNIGKFQEDNLKSKQINNQNQQTNLNKDIQPTIVAQEIQTQKHCEEQKDFYVDRCPNLSSRASISSQIDDKVNQNEQQSFENLSEQKEDSNIEVLQQNQDNDNDTNKLEVEQQQSDSPIFIKQQLQQTQLFPILLNTIEESMKESTQQLLSEEDMSLQNIKTNEAESLATSIELISDCQDQNEKRSENKKKSVFIQKNQAAKLSQFYNKKMSLIDNSQSIDQSNENSKKIEYSEEYQYEIDMNQKAKEQLNESNNLKLPESSFIIQDQEPNPQQKNDNQKQESNVSNQYNKEIQTENKQKDKDVIDKQIYFQKQQVNQDKIEIQVINQSLTTFDQLNMEQKVMLEYRQKEENQNGESGNLLKQLDKNCLTSKNNKIVDLALKEVFDKSATDSINHSFVQQSNEDESFYREKEINTVQNLVDTHQHLPTNLNIIDNQNSSKQLIGDNIQYFLSRLEELKNQQDKQDKIDNSITDSNENIPPIKNFRANSINLSEKEEDQSQHDSENNESLEKYKKQLSNENKEQNKRNQESNQENNESNLNKQNNNLVKKKTQKFIKLQKNSAESNDDADKDKQINIQTSFDQLNSQASLKSCQLQMSKTNIISIKQSNLQNQQYNEKEEFFLDSSQSLDNQQSLEQSQINDNISKNSSSKMNESQQQQISSKQDISQNQIKITQNEVQIDKIDTQSQLETNQVHNNQIDQFSKGLEQGISLALPDKIISINNQQMSQQIHQISLENSQIYSDKDFQPNESSLSQNMKKFQRGNGLQWKRIKEFKQNHEKHSDINIFGQNNQISVKDTVQGWLANCYFVASLTCISQYPNLVKRLFNPINCNTNKDSSNQQEFQQKYDVNSAYSINLCIDGEWKTTIIDDFLPYRKNDSDPVFCKFSNLTKIYWTSLLEKSYAKFKGSYSNIEGGKNKNGSSDAVIDLTGAPSKHIRFQNSNKDEIWNTINEGKKKGFLFTTMLKEKVEASQTSSQQMQLDEQANKNGLISNHAYSILATDIIDENKILKLKNPWGKTEWNGKWSDQCNQTWTEKLKEQQKLEVADDGIFWISFNDYYDNFGSFCVSYVHQDYYYSSLSYQNEQQSDKNIITYTIQPLDQKSQGYFILYQNREHLEEYEKNQYVNHLAKIHEMTEDGENIVKQISQMYISTTKLAFTEIDLEPNKVYKIVVVTEKPSKLVFAFYTSKLIPLSQKQLQFNCSDDILIKQARLLAKKEKINTNYQVYWISFFCDQDHIVEISNETDNIIFNQSIQFILTNLSIDPQLKDKAYNTIKVQPMTTNRYIFKRIDQKQPVQFCYSKYDAEFSSA